MGPLLEIKNLGKSYGELAVLQDISFAVNKGEIVAITGPSGSGKSTLLRCINGLEKFQSGDILIEGRSVTQGRIATQKIGMVFQAFNLFPHYTALHNIVNPCRVVRKMKQEEAVDRALELLGKVRLKDKVHSHPHSLSGGQQQRVAIARALAMEPAVMLFDEPTSALDPELAQEVFETIKDLADDGLTMLIVSHQINLVKDFASRIILLNQGRIRADGAPREILS